MLSLEESINNLRRAKSESLSVDIDLLLHLLRNELLPEEPDLLRDTNRTSPRASSGRAWRLVSRPTGRPSNEVQSSAPSDEVGRLGPGLLSPWGDLLLRVERDLLLLDEGDLLLPLLRDQLLRDARDLANDISGHLQPEACDRGRDFPLLAPGVAAAAQEPRVSSA